MEECLYELEKNVTDEMNDNMQKEFTRSEIEEALNQMAPLKSLGPDGFETYFY